MIRRALPLLACFATAASGVADAAQDKFGAEPGVGTVCAWAIYSVLDEVGRRCFPARDAELQAVVREGSQRLDAYMRANGQATDDGIARFKRAQAGAGMPLETLCHGEMAQFYEGMRAVPPAQIRADIDRITARPGAPSWGDCF